MSTLKFCGVCNNILYPKEDKERKVLLYVCGNCDHQVLLSSCLISSFSTMLMWAWSLLLDLRVFDFVDVGGFGLLRRLMTIVSINVRSIIQMVSAAKFYKMLQLIPLFLVQNLFDVLCAIILKRFFSRLPQRGKKEWHCSLPVAIQAVAIGGETDGVVSQ
ncbi:hypothetical protein IEQ34_001410 [Dendrobium chrysotoxum]|uniref:DNA-directed RNA polymerase II subunit RPB9-like zinc ribbon domain-containing protein n=1 Tax=Dendrobium chrysotoxum TaxID=161865 RepID=A0AAV7HN75_DENCH|nr:hypothetical protein IEQ34_001410 [Dendrobium chrysotoxum]